MPQHTDRLAELLSFFKAVPQLSWRAVQARSFDYVPCLFYRELKEEHARTCCARVCLQPPDLSHLAPGVVGHQPQLACIALTA